MSVVVTPQDDLLWQSCCVRSLGNMYKTQAVFVNDCQYSKSSYGKLGSACDCRWIRGNTVVFLIGFSENIYIHWRQSSVKMAERLLPYCSIKEMLLKYNIFSHCILLSAAVSS